MKPTERINQLIEIILKNRRQKGRPVTSMDRAKVNTEAIMLYLDEDYEIRLNSN